MMRILKFNRDDCAPCNHLQWVLEKILPEEYPDVEMYSTDVDKEPECVPDWNLRGVPTLIAIKDAKEVDRMVGFMSEKQVRNFIERNL